MAFIAEAEPTEIPPASDHEFMHTCAYMHISRLSLHATNLFKLWACGIQVKSVCMHVPCMKGAYISLA